ncbi:helix-turn-helix domain-containing protein [Hyphomicrobium sp. 802]|uniref:helix-turn-helix domain-containing protein n=1 Tax=Hyphomicrobium sp. 802 TaxID=1112272 RepID=UPI0004AD436F|nr:helix-turn-helix domain-containing protein [Hyphomicrobium sp. 802]
MALTDSKFSDHLDARVRVFDTEEHPMVDGAFGVFRQAIASAHVPWELETNREAEFAARVERMDLGSAWIKRVKATQHVAVRSRQDISRSSSQGLMIVYMLAGSLYVEQGDQRHVAGSGDLVIFDTAQPAKMSVGSAQDKEHDSIAFFVPNGDLAGISHIASITDALVLGGARLRGPLPSCLTYLSQHMAGSSAAELRAMYEACVSLLPVVTGGLVPSSDEEEAKSRRYYKYQALLTFIDRNLSNPGLSARYVANEYGVSDRYVHKLFSRSGSTFSSYVMAERLNHIAKELSSPTGLSESIGELAQRWGFSDLSTFNRAFKRRYGCAPSRYLQGQRYR